MKKILLFCFALLAIVSTQAQVSLSAGVGQIYSENFDAYSGTQASLPTNWVTNITTKFQGQNTAVPTGSTSAGGFYSMGLVGNADRSAGFQASGSASPLTYTVSFINNNILPIEGLTIDLTWGQWRAAGSTSSVVTVTNVGIGASTSALNSPTPATFGAMPIISSPSSLVLTGLNIAVGATFSLTFSVSDQSGTDANWAFNNFSLTVTDLLPVELTHLSAKPMGTNNMIEWTTASERNNNFFLVEHATDGLRFSEIGKVEGNGTTTIAQEYNFIDENPTKGINYYRLRQVDFDGKSSLSKVVVVAPEKTDVFNIYPTIATESININALTDTEDDTTIEIYDMNGRLVSSSLLGKGETSKILNIQDLHSGSYVVRMQTNLSTQTIRFIKQ